MDTVLTMIAQEQKESMDLESLESLKVPIWDLPQVHKTHVDFMVKFPWTTQKF